MTQPEKPLAQKPLAQEHLAQEPLALAAGFPQPTADAWRRLVDTALKGAPFERLACTTYDGLRIAPLAARRADARPVAGRAGAAPWQVQARVDHPDPARAQALAREEVDNGATALSLVFAGSAGDHGFGLPARADVLAHVLEGLDLAAVAIELDLSPASEAAVDAAVDGALALAAARPASLRLGHDPLGAMAVAGAAARPWDEQAGAFARRLAALARAGLARQKLAAADGRIIHNAGGSPAQELAFVLGTAVAYLRALEAEGVPLATARGMLFFRLTADTDQLLTIAKFRALRKLWARVEASCGLAPAPAFVCAETAWRTMARHDPHTNILRATIAVFGAALGGADAISVLPFTAALGLPEPFARRVARNTQLVLLEESRLAMVADPVAGAGSYESLTDQLCHAAWRDFQAIEAAGGAAAALAGGLIGGAVAAARAQRLAALSCGSEPLTGVSIYADLDEVPPAVAQPRAAAADAGAGADTLAPIRLARPFEALREACDRDLAATGTRPGVLLACLGSAAEFTPMASFAANFFAAAGLATTIVETAHRDATSAETLANCGAALVCLCGTERAYDAEAAAALARSLKTAGAGAVYLCGRPGPHEAALRQAGVQGFVYDGCDALAALRAAHNILGVEEAAR